MYVSSASLSTWCVVVWTFFDRYALWLLCSSYPARITIKGSILSGLPIVKFIFGSRIVGYKGKG